jgi:hypothetical protein
LVEAGGDRKLGEAEGSGSPPDKAGGDRKLGEAEGSGSPPDKAMSTSRSCIAVVNKLIGFL